MTFGYRLLLETIEAAPAPDIEYLGMASGGEEPAAEVSFLSPPLRPDRHRGGDDPRPWGRVVGRAGRQVLLQVEEHK
jgi:hypothetical protein